uniref:Uncharacterized protein n=1 Tax=Trichogramma kaykai TaxID=54128 RepID=A0ABD2XEI1_9HYME
MATNTIYVVQKRIRGLLESRRGRAYILLLYIHTNGPYSRSAESAMMLKTFIRLSARCYICVNAKST